MSFFILAHPVYIYNFYKLVADNKYKPTRPTIADCANTLSSGAYSGFLNGGPQTVDCW